MNAITPDSDALQQFQGFALLSGLLNLDQLSEAFSEFRAIRQPDLNERDLLDGFSTFLIERRLLTDWQCSKLRNGQYKGFYLGGCQLLSPISHDELTNVYLAEEAATGVSVKVVVTPPERSGTFSYRVERE